MQTCCEIYNPEYYEVSRNQVSDQAAVNDATHVYLNPEKIK